MRVVHDGSLSDDDPVTEDGRCQPSEDEPRRRGLWFVLLVALIIGPLAWGAVRSSEDAQPNPAPTLPGLDLDRPEAEVVWRELPSAPIAGRRDHGMVWTADRVVVAGGTASDSQGRPIGVADSAAFDPAVDRWERLGNLPRGMSGVTKLLNADGAVVAVTDGGLAWLQDGASQWVALSPPPVRASSGATVWDGERLVVVAEDGAAAWERAEEAWGMLPRPEVLVEVVASISGHVVVGSWDGGWARLDAAAEEWTPLPDLPTRTARPPDARVRAETTSLGLLVWLEPTSRSARQAVHDQAIILDPQWWAWRAHQLGAPGCGGEDDALWLGYATVAGEDGVFAWGGSLEGKPTARGLSSSTSGSRVLPEVGAGREGAGLAWTGSDLLVWGGWDGTRPRSDGWAYTDPEQLWPHRDDPWTVEGSITGVDELGPFGLELTEASLRLSSSDEVRMWFDGGFDDEFPGIGLSLGVERVHANDLVRVAISEFARGSSGRPANSSWWIPLDPPLPWLSMQTGDTARASAAHPWPDIQIALSRPSDTRWSLLLTGDADEPRFGLDRAEFHLQVDRAEPPWSTIDLQATIATQGHHQSWDLRASAPPSYPRVLDRILQAIAASGGPDALPFEDTEQPVDELIVRPAALPVQRKTPTFDVRADGTRLVITNTADGAVREIELPESVEVATVEDDSAVVLADGVVAWVDLPRAAVTHVKHVPFELDHVTLENGATYATARRLVLDITQSTALITVLPRAAVDLAAAGEQIHVLDTSGTITAVDLRPRTAHDPRVGRTRLPRATNLLQDRARILVVDDQHQVYELTR